MIYFSVVFVKEATALIVILCEERIRIQNERYSCIQSF